MDMEVVLHFFSIIDGAAKTSFDMSWFYPHPVTPTRSTPVSRIHLRSAGLGI